MGIMPNYMSGSGHFTVDDGNETLQQPPLYIVCVISVASSHRTCIFCIRGISVCYRKAARPKHFCTLPRTQTTSGIRWKSMFDADDCVRSLAHKGERAPAKIWTQACSTPTGGWTQALGESMPMSRQISPDRET